MDEHKPLAYFTPGEPDAAEQTHRNDRRMTYGVLTVGAAMVIGVFTVPEFLSMLNPPAARAPARVPAPTPLSPASSPRATRPESARILMALEAYRKERGVYPASLGELSRDPSDARADAARWRYVRDPDGAAYDLHYVGDTRVSASGPSPSRRSN